MESFDNFFGVSVGKLVPGHGDNLPAALQGSTISAAEGQRIASLTAKTLAKIHSVQYMTLGYIERLHGFP